MKIFRAATGAKATYYIRNSFLLWCPVVRNWNKRGGRLELAENTRKKQNAFFRAAALAIAAAYLFFGSRIASAGLEGMQKMDIFCYCWYRNDKRRQCRFQKLGLVRWLPFILPLNF